MALFATTNKTMKNVHKNRFLFWIDDDDDDDEDNVWLANRTKINNNNKKLIIMPQCNKYNKIYFPWDHEMDYFVYFPTIFSKII